MGFVTAIEGKLGQSSFAVTESEIEFDWCSGQQVYMASQPVRSECEVGLIEWHGSEPGTCPGNLMSIRLSSRLN